MTTFTTQDITMYIYLSIHPSIHFFYSIHLTINLFFLSFFTLQTFFFTVNRHFFSRAGKFCVVCFISSWTQTSPLVLLVLIKKAQSWKFVTELVKRLHSPCVCDIKAAPVFFKIKCLLYFILSSVQFDKYKLFF